MKIMNLRYLFAVPVALLAFTACEDLDTKPEGDILTSEQKQEISDALPKRAEAGVRAVFTQFNVYAPNYSLFGTVRHNDFGFCTILAMTDANTEDVVAANSGYNWYGGGLRYTDRSYTSYESDIVWNNHYSIIFSANNVIASIDPQTTDSQAQFYLAQGLAGRAFAYWSLAQLYQFNYKGHENSPCVPLITNENSSDAALNGAPRATVQAVYDQIKADLDKAIELLTATKQKRSDRRYIDLSVAYGLRARMNMSMQNWSAAAQDASSAISSSDARPATIAEVSAPTFSNSTEPDWMWGVLIAETDDVVSSGIVNWISHCGTFNYGYCQYSGGRQMSKKLYESIDDTDIRKGWFTNEKGVCANVSAEWQAYLSSTYPPTDKQKAAGAVATPYLGCKFAPYQNVLDNDVNANDIPLMRIEEMYLIKAEAEAMAGGNGKATLVEFVKTYRDPSYEFNGSDVQAEVYRQKRIEFWGEGIIWYDVMRLNKGVDRRGAGYTAAAIFNIPSGDPILLWRLPQSEIQGNSALTDDDNNKATEAPTPVDDADVSL